MRKTTTKATQKASDKPRELLAPTNRANAVKAALLPSANAAAVMTCYGETFGVVREDAQELFDQLADGMKSIWDGDMKRPEAMLFGQAQALQSVFTALARRAESAEYMKNWEAYLRMAMKAQNQCRMTLETLATIKNPPVVFARQANINNGGQQQVNNGAELGNPNSTRAPAGTHAANPSTKKTGLLSDGERLDTRAASATGGADPHIAAVGAVHRPAHR